MILSSDFDDSVEDPDFAVSDSESDDDKSISEENISDNEQLEPVEMADFRVVLDPFQVIYFA